MAKAGRNTRVTIVRNLIPGLRAALPTKAGMIVRKTLADMEADVKADMAKPKHGRKYTSMKTKRAHVASAPGESPAIDTGALVNSIATKMTDDTSGVMFTNQEYAAELEEQKNRPFFEPAAERRRASFVDAMRSLV